MTLPFIPEQRMGSKSAPFVLVEFSDLQCPFCNDFAKRTLPVFIDRYVKSGKVLLLSVEFPLESHPEANKLSMASICAGKQSKYWQMREALMNMKAPSVDAAISAASASLGLDESALKSCASSSEVQRPLKTRVEQAKTAGVYSTPTFLLGKIEGNAVRGVSFVGDISPSEFSAKVETAMRQVTGGTNEQSKVDINIK
jgi:protein-disulfide isomerase